jgi:hypothetical protein
MQMRVSFKILTATFVVSLVFLTVVLAAQVSLQAADVLETAPATIDTYACYSDCSFIR